MDTPSADIIVSDGRGPMTELVRAQPATEVEQEVVAIAMGIDQRRQVAFQPARRAGKR